MCYNPYLYAVYIILTITPFSVLRYYPFRHQMRLKPVLFWGIYSCLLVFEILWFIGIQYNGQLFGLDDPETVRFIFYLLYLLLSCIVIKETPAKHLFVWLISMIFSSTLTSVAWLAASLFPRNPPYLVGLLVLVAILPFFMCGGFYFLKHIIMPLLAESSNYAAGLMTLILGIFFMLGLLLLQGLPTHVTQPYLLLCTRLLISLVGIAVCCIFKYLMRDHQQLLALQKETQEKEALLKLSQTQFIGLSERIAEAKHARHDLKHHLRAVQGFLTQGDYDQLAHYIHNYVDTLPPDTPLTFCQHPTTNTILSYYHAKATQHKITMQIQVALPVDFSPSDVDWWVLLGNLLENALEASLRLTDVSGHIKVTISTKGHAVGIAIDNRCHMASLHPTATGYASSKATPESGHGLSSIRTLTSKYNGVSQFNAQDGWFYASVYIPF